MRQQAVAVLAIAVMGIACTGGGSAREASPAGASAPPPPASAGAVPSASTSPGQASRPPTQPPTPMQAAFSAFSMSQSPLAIAKDGGYFAEEGLDVTVSHVSSSAQTAAALLSGEMDVVTTGGVGIIRARLAGSDLLLVAGTKPYFAGSIVVRPEIISATDLRGKRIGITAKGGNTDLMARAVLPRLGLEPDRDVTLFSTGNDLQTVSALMAGNVEAGSMTPPSDERAKNEGMHYLADVTAMKIPYPATALGTSGATATNRGEVLERYLRAYAKAVHRYVTDKEYTLGVAAEFLRTDDRAANELAYEIERGHMPVDLALPMEAVRGTLDLIKDEEPRAATARPEEFVDFRVLDRIKQSGFFDKLLSDQPTR